jgi:ketosteroid isomerase-like protein
MQWSIGRSARQRSIVAAGATLALLAATACTAKVDNDANAVALMRLDDGWSRAAVAKDLNRVASYYAADAIAYPPNATAALGRDAAKAVWAAYFADSTFSISWKTVHAGASGDLGYTSGTYEDSYRGPGGKVVHEVGKYLCIWKQQADGSWQAIHDMWNADTK